MTAAAPREPVRRSLDCGASLVVVPRADLPIFAVQVLIDAGHMVEAPGEDGVLYLAGRMLLSGGAGPHTGTELFEALESRGIRYSTPGSGLGLQAPVRHAELVYDVLTAAVRSPRFEDDRYELEHGRLRNELLAARGEPRIVARHELGRCIYGDVHPLGRPARGTLETLASHTRERVASKYERHVGPDRLLFAAAGAVDPDEVAHEIDRRLTGWQAELEPRPTWPEPERPSTGETHFLERDKEKLHVYMGHLGIRRRDPDYYPLLVFDQIFGSGSGFTSRLSARVRDRLGLAYSVFGGIAMSAGREPGMLLVYAGTFPDRQDEVTGAVREVLAELLEHGVTDGEVESARRYLRGTFLFETETNQQLADLGITLQLHDLPLDFPRWHLEQLDAVTADQVVAAARRHVHPEALTTVACGRRV